MIFSFCSRLWNSSPALVHQASGTNR